MYQKTTLPNGLRLLTAPMPHTHSVSIGIYVGAGSRYERQEEAGLSHFVEHLCFKGSHKRPTAKDIAEAIDGVGGLLNGGTDRELTVYYCKVAALHFGLALDVLVDMVRAPRFDPEEMEKERRVILEELAMIGDSPSQLVDLLMDEALWPDQPLGWDVAGTEQSVKAITREMALDYLCRQYVPNNMVVAIAGNVDPRQVEEQVAAFWGDRPPGSPSPWFPATDGHGPRCALRYKKTEQSHLCLAVRGLPMHHPDRHALALLSVILGEGMSSRLFLELREKQGLVYDVHSYVSHFLDTGAFTVYAGVDPPKTVAALHVILEELVRLRDGVQAEELVKAKEMSKGRLLLRLEDSRSVAGWLGGQELLLGEVRTPEEVVTLLEAVTEEDLRRVAQKLLVTDQLYLALVGPFRSDRRFAPLLKL
ncbi:MAG: pitrilysin family protein [Chloroflexota bacterium]|nr:pitrilysin family protein [Chloroflexota bacterium]